MDAAHAQLLKEIEVDARRTGASTGRPVFGKRVMWAMAEIPRHEFVPEEERGSAYLNYPLPIGSGQTISQPYIVALMTELLDLTPESKVLEVGAGSGYQAAVLSRLTRSVHSVEIIPKLARACRERLARLGIENVVVHEGDGAAGVKAEAPFDGILVTAAARGIPPELVRQLRAGGRMVIPLGAPGGVQELVLLEKNDRNSVSSRGVLPVRFVPLTGTGNSSVP